ncbi:MAG: hypothetical protein R3C16_13150 [Hyphomonadaceae bacterium]
MGYTYNSVTNDPILQSIDHSYEDTLPSLNMVIEPAEDFLVRFGARR